MRLVSRRSSTVPRDLADSEERLRQIVEASAEVLWLRDARDGRLLYLSPAYEELWGRSVDGPARDPALLLEGVAEGDRARVGAAFDAGGGGSSAEEYRVLRPDGSSRWILTRSFPVIDSAGRVVRVASVSADITDRKLVEECLQESEEHCRLLFDTSLAGSYRATLQGKILDCNPAFVSMFGFPDRETALRTPLSFLYDDLAMRATLLERLVREESFTAETRLRRHDGEEIWVVLRETLVSRPSIRLLEGSVLDVTARQRTEEALEMARVEQQRIAQQMADGLVVLDEDGFIASMNEAADRIFGYEKGELIGSHSAVLIPPNEPARTDPLKSLRHAYHDHERRPSRWMGRRKSGELFPFELRLSSLVTPGGLRMFGQVRELASDSPDSQRQVLDELRWGVRRLSEGGEGGGHLAEELLRRLDALEATLRRSG